MTQNTSLENLLADIMENGYDHGDRTGVGRRSVQGRMIRYDISGGKVPVTTTRKAPVKGATREMLCFIAGITNVEKMRMEGVSFWDQWAVTPEAIEAFVENRVVPMMVDIPEDQRPFAIDQAKKEFTAHFNNSIGPMYGAMWRNAPVSNSGKQPYHMYPDIPESEIPSDKWPGIKEILDEEENVKGSPLDAGERQYLIKQIYYSTGDQLNELLRNLKHRPFSSRLCATAWVPEFVPFETFTPEENVLLGRNALAACHAFFQLLVKPPKEEGGKKRLTMVMYQRSADVAVGSVSNIVQYAVLAHLLAHVSDMESDEFVYMLGDAHIYFNQFEGVKEQLTREPFTYPTITINPDVKDLFKITMDDIKFSEYESHPAITFAVAK